MSDSGDGLLLGLADGRLLHGEWLQSTLLPSLDGLRVGADDFR